MALVCEWKLGRTGATPTTLCRSRWWGPQAPAAGAAPGGVSCNGTYAETMSRDPFDVDAFLARPLVARVATSGPAVRPVWFLWEDGAFWWITGSHARLPELLVEDPRVALVVDTCDLNTLEVLQVTARGEAEVVPFDEARAKRKLVRYLGDDEETWPPDFREFGPDTRLVRLVPSHLIAADLSKVRPA